MTKRERHRVRKQTRLKELRKASGLNQTAFGEKVGVSLRTIQYYEDGKFEVPEAVDRLLDFLFPNGEKTTEKAAA